MNTITVTVRGGVIQHIENIPVGVEVRVVDFDAYEEPGNRVEIVDGKPGAVAVTDPAGDEMSIMSAGSAAGWEHLR